MRLITVLMLFGILLWGCDSQNTVEDPTATHFIKFYGRDGDQTGRDLVVLPDGSMVLFGTTRPTVAPNGTQWYLARVDAKGAILWETEFGGVNDEEARDIELTSGNELVLVGNTYKSKTPVDRDVFIMTVGLDGKMKKSAVLSVRDSLGAPSTGDEDVTLVSETTDGFIISGSTTYVGSKAVVPGIADTRDALKMRVDTDLIVYPNSWVQTYGYFSDDVSTKIIEESPGNFHVFGYTNNLPPGQTVVNYNYWVYLLGADGDPVGEQTYPGTISGNEKLTSYGKSSIGYYLGGVSQSGTGASDFFASEVNVRTATEFGILFEKTLSINLGSGLSGHTAVFPSQQGGFLIMGNENGFDNNQNWVLTRLNNEGTPVWSSPIVFGGEGLDECGSIKELADGRLMIIGTMRTGRPDAGEFKLTLIKVNSEGKLEN